MNVVGIIAEYNPFHKGHAYHIEQAKKICQADACVVIMSPDFVQRGEPAIMNKYDRAHAAMLCGADCVLEMPVAFATGAARTFAEAGVALLEKTGIITHLCFGSECGDLTSLNQIASILAQEPEEYTSRLKTHLKNGLSFPAARQQALEALLGPAVAALVLSPNNILAIEYLRALILRSSSITPVTLTRTGDYHGTDLTGITSSATSLRRHLADTAVDLSQDAAFWAALPEQTHACILQQHLQSMPLFANDFSAALHYRLLTLREDDFTRYEDISEDLANQIKKNMDYLSSFEDFAERCKSRQYTRTRINRALLHILLDITKSEMRNAQIRDYGNYIRILGFRDSFKPWLSEIKKNQRVTLITKIAGVEKQLSPEDLLIFRQTLFASDLHRAAASTKYGLQPYNEYTRGLIRIVD